ncbi:class C sortase [Ruminococcaceae bacterium OttesenSCG-928-A16]|nr:class C sortase [Ruminococcaceae bacterium OttesenSCG-928-A16]
MKKILGNLVIFLVAIVGVGLLVYPHLGFLLAQKNSSYVIQEYDSTLASMDDAERKQQLAQAASYNSQLAGGIVADPFAAGDTAENEEYTSVLNLGGGMMGHIRVPKINIDIPIYHGTAGATLLAGVGHLQGSALPVGGAGTHCVLTGHTGLDTAKMFTDLTELALGDEFYLYTMDEVLAYRIDHIVVVEPSDTTHLQPVPGQEYATLVTCTPYGINSHRLLVRGTRVPYTPQQLQQAIAQTKAVLSKEALLFMVGVGALCVLVLVFVVVVVLKRLRKKRRRGTYKAGKR